MIAGLPAMCEERSRFECLCHGSTYNALGEKLGANPADIEAIIVWLHRWTGLRVGEHLPAQAGAVEAAVGLEKDAAELRGDGRRIVWG